MPGGLHPPIALIASWPLNYTPGEFETSGFYIVIIVAAFLGLAWLVFFLRMWSRIFIAKNFGVDDALIIFNMIPLTGTAVGVILAMTRYGFDRHVWNIPTAGLLEARKISLANELMYMVSTCTTKVSILLFYRRLVSGAVSRAFLYCVYASIAYVAVYFVIYFLALFGICVPLSTYWKQADWGWYEANSNSFHCLPEGKMLISSAVISASQDFIACGLPMILFSTLQMPRRQKIALSMVFMVGIFLCICSVLRTIYIYRTFYDTYDMTWASQPAWLWLSLETELAVVCASAPALKVFFKKAFQMTTSKSRSSSSKDKSNSTGRAPSRSSMHKLDQWDISVDTEHSGGLSDVEFTTYDYGKSADFGSAAGVEYDRYGQRITQESEKVAYDRYGQRIGPPSTPWSRSGPLSAPPSRRGTPSAPPSRSGPPSAPPSRSGPPQIPLTFFDEPNEIGVTFLEEPDVTDGVFYTTVSDSRYHHAY